MYKLPNNSRRSLKLFSVAVGLALVSFVLLTQRTSAVVDSFGDSCDSLTKAQCPSGTHFLCDGSNQCTTWVFCGNEDPSVSKCYQYFCYDYATCSDGSKTCGDCDDGGGDDGGSVCTPDAKECTGSCGTGCRECLSDGTGWVCRDVSVCGGCSGGDDDDGGCTVTNPSSFNLLAPPDETLFYTNDVLLDWQDVNNWGEGCPNSNQYRLGYIQVATPSTPCPAQESGSYNYIGAGTTSHKNFRNLQWGRTYCWYAIATNSQGSRNSNQTWKFTTIKAPDIDDWGVTSYLTPECGTRTSGNASIDGTDNPITFFSEFSLDDNGSGIDEVKEIALAIVPAIYANAGTVSEETLASKTKNYFMALATIDYNNPDQSQFRIVNSDAYPYYSSPQTSGNLTNSAGTATLMNLNDSSNPDYTHVEVVDANTVRIYWQIRFEDNYKYKNNGALFDEVIKNRIYTAAFREYMPGKWNSSAGGGAIDRGLENMRLWKVNVQIPKAKGPTPQVIDTQRFKVNWRVEAIELMRAEGYMWTDLGNIDIRRTEPAWLPTREYTLNPTEPDISTDPIPNSNVQAFYRDGAAVQALGIHAYRILNIAQPDDSINTKMYITDSACNTVTDSGSVLTMGVGWLMTAGGDTFSRNFELNNIGIAQIPAPLDYLNAFSYLSTYITSVSNSTLTTQARISRYNFVLEGYDDWNSNPPKTADEGDWYTYIYNLVDANSEIRQAQSTTLASGTSTKDYIATEFPDVQGDFVVAQSGCGDGFCNFWERANKRCEIKTILGNPVPKDCNTNATIDFCRNDCTWCGDGTIQANKSEECDHAGSPDENCDADCKIPEQGSGETSSYESHILIKDNFTIESTTTCNTQTIFFIEGNLTINPDFTIQNDGSNQMGCMFFVGGDLHIQAGDFKDYYDLVHGFFFVKGGFYTYEDQVGGSFDGLYIKGSVINKGTNNLDRAFELLNNAAKPSEIIEYDSRYANIFGSELKIKDYSLREKDFIEKINY